MGKVEHVNSWQTDNECSIENGPLVDSRNDITATLSTSYLETSLDTNNAYRIKRALHMPFADLNRKMQKHNQMTILMRLCYLEISTTTRRDLFAFILDSGKFTEHNAQDLTGKTALMHACIQRKTGLIKLLAEIERTDPKLEDSDGDTALIHACRTGSPLVVETLINSFNLNINSYNKQGMSPLLEAARLGHTSVIRVLVIDGSADVTRRDLNRNSAVTHLITSGQGSTQDFLLLWPAAYRKRKARLRRQAAGRRSFQTLLIEAKEARLRRRPSAANYRNARRLKNMKSMQRFGSYEKISAQTTANSPEQIRQLNSIVFQVATSLLPTLVEMPIEEESEDIQRSDSGSESLENQSQQYTNFPPISGNRRPSTPLLNLRHMISSLPNLLEVPSPSCPFQGENTLSKPPRYILRKSFKDMLDESSMKRTLDSSCSRQFTGPTQTQNSVSAQSSDVASKRQAYNRYRNSLDEFKMPVKSVGKDSDKNDTGQTEPLDKVPNNFHCPNIHRIPHKSSSITSPLSSQGGGAGDFVSLPPLLTGDKSLLTISTRDVNTPVYLSSKRSLGQKRPHGNGRTATSF